MKHIAILGGGISGLSAAYELARQQRAGAAVEFILFEATNRLGGIVETEHHGEFVIECGPDSWVTEKPWARELAVELGLESEIIFSQDKHRKTYLAERSGLHAIPDGMRMMVPVEWARVLDSTLLSQQAKLGYLREPGIAGQLKTTALLASRPPRDESVKDFVARHFGAEVADTIAAPLLAGVFGGDIATLSARAVLPAYVALEYEYGSLILGLQQRKQSAESTAPIFSTLRNGLSGLIAGMESRIPARNIRRGFAVDSIEWVGDSWRIAGACDQAPERFDGLLIATPSKTTAQLLAPLNPHMVDLLPQHSSSAIVVAFAFSAEQAQFLQIPQGFGFLVPQRGGTDASLHEGGHTNLEELAQRALLACTFVDQKFSHRAPAGAVLLRAFFGGPAAPALLGESDSTLRRLAHTALGNILGALPEPGIAVDRRWPDSLPLYSVGHLDRIAELESCVAKLPQLRLIGNAYRGVGLPDLIRGGRSAAREMIAALLNIVVSDASRTA